ncbi:MAG TPA: hypothetical protein VHL58_04870 [Thermoanaerobaculia bacterium]|nr:hypothetical protein [Thermoanaerobaculia bacterium]
MKNVLKPVLVLLTLTSLSCGTSSSGRAQIIEPEIQLVQTQGPSDMNYSGPVSIKFEMQVDNRSGEPIILRKLDLRNIGSGPYVLRSRPVFFNSRFPAQKVSTIEFWAEAYSRGGPLGSDEPVMVRGIAYFDTPAGPLHKIFTQMISQYRNQR